MPRCFKESQQPLFAIAYSLAVSTAWIDTSLAAEASIFTAKMTPTATAPRATTNFQSIMTIDSIELPPFWRFTPRIKNGSLRCPASYILYTKTVLFSICLQKDSICSILQPRLNLAAVFEMKKQVYFLPCDPFIAIYKIKLTTNLHICNREGGKVVTASGDRFII